MAESRNCVNKPPHFTYFWTIENICFPCRVYSPTFTVKEMEMTKWYLAIGIYNSEFVEIEVWREKGNDEPSSIEIKFVLSFLGVDGVPLIEKVGVEKFAIYFQFEEFADKREVFFRRREEFLPKDALEIRFQMWRTGTEIARVDSCFARTLLRPNRRSFVWAIREFSTLQPFENQKIILNLTSNRQLTFNLYATGDFIEESISIGISDSLDEIDDEDSCKIKISLLDSEGKAVHSQKRLQQDTMLLFYDFFKKETLMNNKASLLPGDVLTLRCEIEMNADIVWSVIENYRLLNSMTSGVIATDTGEILLSQQDKIANVSSTIAKAVKSLLDEGTASDVSLRAGSKSIPAHKCILSARSPVFKAMFGGDMKEKTSKCVEIPDVDEDTLRGLLSYIYTDKVGDLEWRSATDLYRAADKYELLDLKRRCADLLKSDLSESSVCTVFSVADLHNDRELREAAQGFVMRQGAKFFASDTWRSFKEENSRLAWEIVDPILCNMKGH